MLKNLVSERYTPYITTFILSLAFSCLAISTDNLLNHDAVLFMNSAKVYLREGMAALFEVFHWPFYSWCVAVAHQALWFSHIEQTAHFINALFIGATCILFIRIYEEITEGEGSLWAAAILVLTLVGINKYRADVMKDFGYWCFYLAGFYSLLRYYKRPSLAAATGWQIFTILAFLFRIEGIVIIIFGPLAMFLKKIPIKERLVQAASLYAVYAVGLIAAIAVVLLTDVVDFGVRASRLSSLWSYIDIGSLVDSYSAAAMKLGEIYWYEGAHSKHHDVLIVVYAFTLLAYVSVRIVGCLGFPYFVVLGFGVFKKRIVLSEYNRIILYFAAFLFLFFVVYMIKGPVLSSRYTTSLVFMLLLLLGQVVERFIPNINSSKHKRKIWAVIILFLFLRTADSIISIQGDSKDYILDAGYWVKDNTAHTVPVYSNYYKALYYTDRDRSLRNRIEFEEMVSAIRSGSIVPSALLVIHVHQENSESYQPRIDELVAAGKIGHKTEFANRDGDKLIIYEVKSNVP
jgi:hypothetical protein